MSYNLVNPTTGDLTKVAGNITSNIIPANASASNKLVAESDTNSTTLTSTDSLASWAGNAKGVMTAFIVTSSKPSDIGTPLSSWGETMIWCIGHGVRKTLFAIDFSVTQHVIYTREYYNGSFITNWTAIKDGNLTSSVISGSTAPITSGGVYSAFNYKSGTVNFNCGANQWTTVEVTFDSPMPDTDYVVTLESSNTAYVHVQNVTTKLTNGFIIIVWNRDELVGDRQGIINWQAYKIPH